MDGLFSKENQLELRTLNGFSVCLWNKSRIFAGKTPEGNHRVGVFAYGMDLCTESIRLGEYIAHL